MPPGMWQRTSLRQVWLAGVRSSWPYAIGVAEPVSILVDTQGTGKLEDEAIEKLVRQHFDHAA